MNAPRASNKALRKAVAHHEAGRAQDARRLYLSVLQTDPRNTDANRGLGLLSVAQGKVEAALPFLTTALQSDPKQPAHWISFVEALLTLGRSTDARAVFEKGMSSGVLSGPAAAELKKRLAHPEFYRQALEHHNSGRLPEAERIYTAILAEDPVHADSLHMIGVLACQTNRAALGVQLISQAIAIKDGVAAYHSNLGSGLVGAGQIDDAIKSFARALELDPNDPETHAGLAGALQTKGLLDEALARCNDALRIKPEHLGAHNIIGNIFKSQGNLEQAGRYYEKALLIDANYAAAHNNIGTLLRASGNPVGAIERYRRALNSDPDFAEAHYNIATTLLTLGQDREARLHLDRATEIQPFFPEAQFALANLHHQRGNLDAALAHYQCVIDGGVKTASSHNNTGAILLERGKHDDAMRHFAETLRQDPERHEAHSNMGNALQKVGKLDEAVRHYRESLRIKPDYAEATSNLAGVLKAQGKLAEAADTYRSAIDTKPSFVGAHNNLIMLLGYSADVPHRELVKQALRFNDSIAAPLLRDRAFSNTSDPNRRLRVGYVSGDFRNHAVSFFFEPLLDHHNHTDFEIFAYSTSLVEDAVTERIKAGVDAWRDISTTDDDDTADMIERDAIDILVDLSGHMAANRLLVFARKPAPVQATWLGFTTTTGVKAIDYRISDNHADPVGMTEHLNVEALWRLPGAFCCYQATKRDIPAIDHPPRDDNGHVTFGCFNNFTKVSDRLLQRWGDILARVPDARLLLEIIGIDGEAFRRETEGRLQRLGIPLDRVILEPRKPANQYVLYNKIDIALDPFPFNGGTTTMDALWMGVPVVTLAGEYFTSRMGVTIMTNAGLPELIASTEDEYVDIAVELATNTQLLDETRRDLRQRVTASRMMDHARFARDIEDAYRGMWRVWCEQQMLSGQQRRSA
jgi:protein O-GlcNAc transferase